MTTLAANRRFYDALWSASYVVPPQRFNTWPLLSQLAASAPARLEIGPGLPSAPPHRGDMLRRRQQTGSLPPEGPRRSRDARRDHHPAIPGFYVRLGLCLRRIEHVEDDRQVFRELGRVAREQATIIFSVPLHPGRWSAFDALAGHVRRYDPDDLLAIVGEHSLVLQQSAGFGMQPRSQWLLDFAVWGLTRRRVQAMRWYNRLFLPLGLFLQRRLAWAPGLIDVAKVDELLVVCGRGSRPSVRHTGGRGRLGTRLTPTA